MTDESKVKTTFIRPVNRTMSYEDRRGYVCMYKQLCAARAGRQAISEEELGCDGAAVCITDAVTVNNL